jgi:RNA polymerase sigma-70 factor (ECF subfamily)
MKKVPCTNIKDTELVSKSLQDADYFSCLYYRYEEKLTRYIRRISNISDEETADILQESFIKIWKNLNEYDTDMALSSWIYRIVHNQTISYWRKLKSYGKDNKISFDEHFTNTEITGIDTSDILETEDKIQHIIRMLPENYQSVLILKYFEEKNYEEISDILRIPEGTVATRLNRAKKAFYKLSKTEHISFFD